MGSFGIMEWFNSIHNPFYFQIIKLFHSQTHWILFIKCDDSLTSVFPFLVFHLINFLDRANHFKSIYDIIDSPTLRQAFHKYFLCKTSALIGN